MVQGASFLRCAPSAADCSLPAPPVHAMPRSAILNVMVGAATKAARGLKRDFGEVEQLQVSRKGPADFVSAADRRSEEIIRGELARARPSYGFLMEESGETRGDDPQHRWIVDPLDGTTNYLYRFPAWAVSIALEDEDGAAAGIVHAPVLGETFVAVRGEGATLNGEAIRVNDHEDLATALVATGFGYDPDVRAGQAELLRQVIPHVRDIRRAGAAAVDLCYVACGRLDGYYERGINHWDWAAGALIVREAGGEIVPLEGGREGLAAAGPRLVHQLAELVREPAT